MKQKKLGVTLVEIMIVVAIIGIVAAFAIPNYLRSRQTADTASLEQTARQIAQKMEQIFWGQNPNEYPPELSMPSGLVTWAAPTNLGNIQDLLELLKKICEQQGKSLSSGQIGDLTASEIAADPEAMQALVETCFQNNPPLTYTTPAGGQTYLFSVSSPNGTNYTASPGGVSQTPPDCTGDAGCDDGVYCNGVETCQYGSCQAGISPCDEGYTCHESYQECTEGICGNGIWEGYEECGEEDTGFSYEFMECINCRWEFVGCPEGYYFYDWACYPSPPDCPSGSYKQPGLGCCWPDPGMPPWPRPIQLPTCGEVAEVIPDGGGPPPMDDPSF